MEFKLSGEEAWWQKVQIKYYDIYIYMDLHDKGSTFDL